MPIHDFALSLRARLTLSLPPSVSLSLFQEKDKKLWDAFHTYALPMAVVFYKIKIFQTCGSFVDATSINSPEIVFRLGLCRICAARTADFGACRVTQFDDRKLSGTNLRRDGSGGEWRGGGNKVRGSSACCMRELGRGGDHYETDRRDVRRAYTSWTFSLLV